METGTPSVSPDVAPAKSVAGYVALALAVCAMLAPVFFAYLLFPAALVATIIAWQRKAPMVKWALLPLCIAGAGLIYSGFLINKATGEINQAVEQLRGLSK